MTDKCTLVLTLPWPLFVGDSCGCYEFIGKEVYWMLRNCRNFYRAQVYLGSSLYVYMYVT